MGAERLALCFVLETCLGRRRNGEKSETWVHRKAGTRHFMLAGHQLLDKATPHGAHYVQGTGTWLVCLCRRSLLGALSQAGHPPRGGCCWLLSTDQRKALQFPWVWGVGPHQEHMCPQVFLHLPQPSTRFHFYRGECIKNKPNQTGTNSIDGLSAQLWTPSVDF